MTVVMSSSAMLPGTLFDDVRKGSSQWSKSDEKDKSDDFDGGDDQPIIVEIDNLDEVKKRAKNSSFARCDLLWISGTKTRAITPVEGVELHPVIIVRDKGGRLYDDDELSVDSPIGRSVHILYRWLRGPPRAVCSFHPHVAAKLQCTVTLRCFCGYSCFERGHHQLHQFYITQGAYPIPAHPNSHTYGVPCRPFNWEDLDSNKEFDAQHYTLLQQANLLEDSTNSEDWHLLSTERNYTPTADDLGHHIRFETLLVDIPKRVIDQYENVLYNNEGNGDMNELLKNLLKENPSRDLMKDLESDEILYERRCSVDRTCKTDDNNDDNNATISIMNLPTACFSYPTETWHSVTRVGFNSVASGGLYLESCRHPQVFPSRHRKKAPSTYLKLVLDEATLWKIAHRNPSTHAVIMTSCCVPSPHLKPPHSSTYLLDNGESVKKSMFDENVENILGNSDHCKDVKMIIHDKLWYSKSENLSKSDINNTMKFQNTVQNQLHSQLQSQIQIRNKAKTTYVSNRCQVSGGVFGQNYIGFFNPQSSDSLNPFYPRTAGCYPPPSYDSISSILNPVKLRSMNQYRRHLLKDQDSLLLPPPPHHHSKNNIITVMSWNVLAEIYATESAFPHCNPYVLAWPFRKARVLNEIVRCNPDVACLQEVQSEHFECFFLPELSKSGYAGVYKQKTMEVFASGSGKRRGGKYTKDGCAIFYKKDKFNVVENYAIEFSALIRDAAEKSFSSALMQNPNELHRLLKDNVALVIVLQLQESSEYVLVANTHIVANPESVDVKIWQAHVLLRVLEQYMRKWNLSEKQPGLILVGDFNSTPDSAVYQLLVCGCCPPNHEDLSMDRLGILSQIALSHSLTLSSAYAESRRISSKTTSNQLSDLEPSFTNFTTTFVGCLDYILFTPRSLLLRSTRDVVDENKLHAEADAQQLLTWALPTPLRPSDHIALVAEFELK